MLKGLLLELAVMISRAAVEAGAVQSEVLGMNFRLLTELAGIVDDEDLAAWLRKTLEHVFSTIERQEDFTPPLLVTKALDFMRRHLRRDISRDETVKHAGISPSHFSRPLSLANAKKFESWSITGWRPVKPPAPSSNSDWCLAWPSWARSSSTTRSLFPKCSSPPAP